MQASDLANKALAAFVIINAALKRSRRLHRFTLREDLTRRMPGFTVRPPCLPCARQAITHAASQHVGDTRPPREAHRIRGETISACAPADAGVKPHALQVRLGFGLHVGWAIEGAIGSEYKIDASYLSPNVNMAARLEAATKQFGVSILLSEDFACMLSASVRQRVRQARPGPGCVAESQREVGVSIPLSEDVACTPSASVPRAPETGSCAARSGQALRAQIDCVTVKGSTRPLGLFTYDVTLDRVSVPAPHDAVAATLAAAAAGLAAGGARTSRSSAAPRTPHPGAHPPVQGEGAVLVMAMSTAAGRSPNPQRKGRMQHTNVTLLLRFQSRCSYAMNASAPGTRQAHAYHALRVHRPLDLHCRCCGCRLQKMSIWQVLAANTAHVPCQACSDHARSAHGQRLHDPGRNPKS